MTPDPSAILPIEQETSIERLRQLARDYREEYNLAFAKNAELQSRLESKERVIKTLEESRTRLLEACDQAQDLVSKTQSDVDASIAHLPRIKALSMALRDAISTYGPKQEILVTAERQEAWQAALDANGMA